MTDRRSYSYVVLRYVHDVMTGEFVNVGLVMLVPSKGLGLVKTRQTISRIKSAFPDLDRHAFLAAMREIRAAFAKIRKRQKRFLPFEGDVQALARQLLPADDSSLQWSSVGVGVSDDDQKTFARLYDRFVARYDVQSSRRRTDDDVWRPVLEKLTERELDAKLHPATVAGAIDDIVFEHAWRNGKLHVYEPVSFDLANADSIKVKAREWLGHLSAVTAEGAAEPFKAHFIVGAPSDPRLGEAYKRALAILRHAPNDPDVFEETQVDELVDAIEDEVLAHDAGDRR
jgi:hypothetical protein